MRLIWPLGLALTLGMVLLAAPGQADSRKIEVVGSVARLGDLLPEARLSERAREVAMAEGLRPGEQRQLTLAELKLRLNEAGIDEPLPLARPVVVRRKARTLLASEIVAAGEASVREALQLGPEDTATLSPMPPPRSLLVPISAVRLEAIARRPALPGGLWVTEVTARADDWSMETLIRFRVRVTGTVLVTRQMVKRGESLAEADVTREKRDLTGLRGEALRRGEELAGRRARRGAPAGTVLTSDWFTPAPVVRRGEVVQVMVQLGVVSASVQATALADGALGETIRVREESGKSEFSARVAAPGRVEVQL